MFEQIPPLNIIRSFGDLPYWPLIRAFSKISSEKDARLQALDCLDSLDSRNKKVVNPRHLPKIASQKIFSWRFLEVGFRLDQPPLGRTGATRQVHNCSNNSTEQQTI